VSESAAAFLTVDEASEGQRVDNYLTKTLKGVPKSHVYRILRSGEVRVNKKRINADFRLSLGDVVRVPPTRATAIENRKGRHLRFRSLKMRLFMKMMPCW